MVAILQWGFERDHEKIRHQIHHMATSTMADLEVLSEVDKL